MVSKSDAGKAILTKIKNNKKISDNLINLLYFTKSLSSKNIRNYSSPIVSIKVSTRSFLLANLISFLLRRIPS